MRLVTGNDLGSGDVVWWTGEAWSRHISDAVDAGDAAEAIAKREEAALRVNVPYVVDAAPGPIGPVPLHIKDRIRATGPTVRPDLAVAPVDPASGSWTI
ncbi:DUF2849 domain-containing protein [Sphingomonas nostoxanthinifaciens]|uniref:DUF2849 domain-containing protein n=1 Tax=Sphingomonas nostoxanthinifaciens TaxID=2872652 RepID=UPI001CC1F154|nr:DUF2849 domain-containing protein [Sphingomonas nostoxanthinifaciens]UAK26192.1 DUF2849 domain-containing protein [Sphingomonas nostoxanthinifaciens]